MKKLFGAFFLVSAVGLCQVACEQDEGQQPELDVDALEQGLTAQEILCDSTVTGVQYNAYLFAAKQGYHFHFTAEARRGVFVEIKDEDTDEILFSDFGWKSLNTTLIPPAHTTYRIFVWGRQHSLRLDCEWPVEPHCVMWETTDADGNPRDGFYAENVDFYEDGKNRLDQVKYFTNESIIKGTCSESATDTFCAAAWAPVCGDSPAPNTTWGNLCEFKRHIAEKAGADDQWKGHWQDGHCEQDMFCGGIAGIECPDGYKCVLEGDSPDAGGSCEPYACTYDGVEYVAGESFPATDGCNKCSCTESGHVACTKMYCPVTCDPEKEVWRDYTSTDPDMCSSILFLCDDTREPFFNDCGCGCQPKKCNPEKEPHSHYVTYDLKQCDLISYTCDMETQAYFRNDCGCGCEDRL